ncbi:tyrosine--tRNA ligase [Mycobacterium decipiens]|uniref:Tyrosine--tRNA ligase n=1 Tax=Mycobacterium decipiens TaxID=1430326 RepID=A0A1X2LXI9_9MYCO|nr:tyrosine--tRNA ligase [Mycobacterium decipiens]OSC41850.1 tyrosine--tRNA ligase [Mycobacterium decipiens]
MSRLDQSVKSATDLLRGADLSSDEAVRTLLEITTARRRLDLSDLPPHEQAQLIASRSQQVQPAREALAERIAKATNDGRPFVAKFGIDPTGSEVHLGHAVPMLILSRIQRMGHHVVFIVGDLTAKVGDPTGRSDERPLLTDEDIARNLATYRHQVAPFFDFAHAEFRFNGDWLERITLPRLLEVASHIPISMPLQREDFRNRLEAGHGLSLAELLYSVTMALDSVEINCDLEVGGIDQYLNMQMCRKVMDICGQVPELVVATKLIEGTDGTGAKMSKSKGNYVAIAAPAGEIYGKLMSVADQAVDSYYLALTEWLDSEVSIAQTRRADGTLHPLDLKKILAGEMTAAIYGVDTAMKAREEFAAQFATRRFGNLADLPIITDPSRVVFDVVRELGFAKSNSDVRRLAAQRALRLVVECAEGQQQVVLAVDDVFMPLNAVAEVSGPDSYFLKAGRKLARIKPPSSR